MKLFVVRHGETAWSRERRFTGACDIPLAAEGAAQAEAVARAFASEQLAALYASPLDRTRTTADIIAKPHRLTVQVDPDLREMAFGRWEGRLRADVARDEPELWRTWREAPATLTSHGGETVADVAARVNAFVARVGERHGGGSVVVVTHAVVIRLLVLGALGLGPERLWSVDASPAGITELELGAEWSTVHRMNTLSHLGATP